jgi:hypothetical protein
MSDFETHEIGTAKELKLSRALYDAIAQQINNEFDDKSINAEIRNAHDELRRHYQWQVHMLDLL